MGRPKTDRNRPGIVNAGIMICALGTMLAVTFTCLAFVGASRSVRERSKSSGDAVAAVSETGSPLNGSDVSPEATKTPEPTAEPTPAPTPSPTPTVTPVPTPTPERTPRKTPPPTNTPSPTPSPTPVPTKIPDPIVTPEPGPWSERSAKIIPPNEVDYTYVNSIPNEILYGDMSHESQQWYCGQWRYDSQGILRCVYDKKPSTLAFLKAHHAFDRLPTTEKKLMLALSAGYDNGTMETAVNIMKERDVRCVFFLTGEPVISLSAEFLRGIIDDGFVIGSHSMYHPAYNKLSNEQAVADLNAFYNTLNNKLGYVYKLRYFMPPSGGATKRTVALLEELGYITTFWTFTYYDYEEYDTMSREDALWNLKNSLFPGCVIYIHATSRMTLGVLGEFIDYAHEQGFSFVLPDEFF